MDELLAAIGFVAFTSAYLEYRINAQIWELVGVNERDGACVTAQIMSFPSRVRALIALVHDRGCSKKLIKDLTAFAEQGDGVARQRNRIIHDPWFFKRGTWDPARLEITANKRLVFEYRPQTVEEIEQIGIEISDCTTAFGTLEHRIRTEIAELRRAPPEERREREGGKFLD